MPRVVLIEPNTKIEQVYRLNLEVYVGLDVRHFKSFEDASRYLSENSCDLIITRNQIKNENVAQNVMNYINQLKVQPPVIVIGEAPFPEKIYAHIPGALDLKLVIKKSADALKITAQTMANKKVDNFFSIPIRFFNFIEYPVCEIYRKDPDQTYSTFCPVEQKTPVEELKKMISDNIPSLYIERAERLKMVNQISAEMLSRLNIEDLDPNEQVQVLESNMDLVSKKLLHIGINEETIALAQKNIDSLTKIAKHTPKLHLLLSRMHNNKSGFMYLHTQALTYVAIHLIKNVDWGNKEQEDKICFMSYFHDIALENDVQALIHSTEELKASQLPSREKSNVEKHAQIAAELVSKFPHAPMGSDQIIKQHHGMLNGIGFSETFNGQLSPMTMLFIVAEEFTHKILMCKDEEINKTAILKELSQKFNMPRFKKVIDLLDSIIL